MTITEQEIQGLTGFAGSPDISYAAVGAIETFDVTTTAGGDEPTAWA